MVTTRGMVTRMRNKTKTVLKLSDKKKISKSKSKSKLKLKENEGEHSSSSSINTIKIGDTVKLSDLLFTKKRDFLINYSQNNKKVKAKTLAGKIIVLQFMSLIDGPSYWKTVITNLLDVYNKLHPRSAFEIVFVLVRDHPVPHYFKQIPTTTRKCFLEKFSTMPWPAIPLSALKTRKCLETMFGISFHVDTLPPSFIIDPTGVVLHTDATPLFLKYGAAAYPFTDERIQFLDSEDYVIQMHPPSIKNLLASPERDYLINNKGDQVPMHDLDNKVVGLYFSPCLQYPNFTSKLKMIYEELSNNMENFEIVLIYVHGWYEQYYGRTDEAEFLYEFQTMPWLAIPFKDTNCIKRLQRLFIYPQELGSKPDYRLVIIGPHGDFIEPWGANISLMYGVPAYPFTSSSAAILELERVNELKVEMLWDLDAVFTKKNGSQVRFSQLVGKNIIVFLEDFQDDLGCTLRELKARYLKTKGTNDEFEVIHIKSDRWSKQAAADMPWLMHHPFDEDSYAGKFIDLNFRGNYHGLLAFDRDGSVVRRSVLRRWTNPVLSDTMDFPFNPDENLENEVLMEVEDRISFDIRVHSSNGLI